MKYIIDGRFLYGQVLGVQRYAREITAQLDKMIKDKPYDVEIAVPQIDSEGTSAEINSYKTKYDNIKIVDITMIKPKTSISVKGEWSHKHIQIVALKGSTAAIKRSFTFNEKWNSNSS